MAYIKGWKDANNNYTNHIHNYLRSSNSGWSESGPIDSKTNLYHDYVSPLGGTHRILYKINVGYSGSEKIQGLTVTTGWCVTGAATETQTRILSARVYTNYESAKQCDSDGVIAMASTESTTVTA